MLNIFKLLKLEFGLFCATYKLMSEKVVKNTKYVSYGEGEVLILLHGLFGSLANFEHTIAYFSKNFRVIVPLLPLYSLDIRETSVNGMVTFLEQLCIEENFSDFILVGNSLGGHVAIVYTLQNPQNVKALVLTGSSGLFERAFGDTLPRRGDYEYIKQKTEQTFYDPHFASKELIDEIFDIVSDREKALRVVVLAKSAVRHHLGVELNNIKVPCQLIWGRQDNITPPFVAEEFQKLIPHAQLHWIEECGHAAMMEQPEKFNKLLEHFLCSLNEN